MTLDATRNVWAGASVAIVGLLVTLFPVFVRGPNGEFSRLHQLTIYGGTAAFSIGVWIALIRSHVPESG